MHVRVSTAQVPLEHLQKVQQAMTKADTSDLHPDKGYRGGEVLINRQNGKILTFGHWETEADMAASLPFHEARAKLAEQAGQSQAIDETYEVLTTTGPTQH